MTTGEAARDTTLVERTAASQPNLSPKMRVDDPDQKPQNKQYEKENNLFQTSSHIVKRFTNSIKIEETKQKKLVQTFHLRLQ